VILAWKDNSNNETGFIIERKDGEEAWGQMDFVAANVTTYTDTNVQAGKTYSYKVNAYISGSPGSVSDYSNEVTITVAGAAKSGTLTLDKTAYAPGEKITVAYAGITAQMIADKAFVSPYKAEAEHEAFLGWQYPATASGTLEFTAPTAAGSYEMRLYSHGITIGEATFVMSVPFTVGAKAATPVASPKGGTYSGEQTVILTCATEGAAIHYTTNGAAPTAASPKYAKR